MLSWIRRLRARQRADPATPAAKLSEPEIASAVLVGAWLASRDDAEEPDALDAVEPEDEEEDELAESDAWEEQEDTDAECNEDEDSDLEWI